MSGRCVIITGANSGLGFKAAEYMSEAGDNVILACRNEDKGKAAVEKIKHRNPQALVTYMQLDLSSVESIKKFVEEFHQTGKKLNVLVNNAGMAMPFKNTKRTPTPDGFEVCFGTNHLGHFLLTNLLLEDLKKTGAENGNSRVIVVSSSLHDKRTSNKFHFNDLDLDDIHYVKPGSYNGLQAYKDSKAAVLMFAYDLARQLEGTGVCVNAMCPGFIPTTGLTRNSPAPQKWFLKYILGGMLRSVVKSVRTVEQGADAIYQLADDEKFKGITGKYFVDLKLHESSEETRDEEKQKKLTELSGGFLKMEGYEPLEVPEPPPEPEPEVAEEKKDEEKAEDKKEEEPAKEEKKDDETPKDEKEPEDKEEKTEEKKDE